MATATAERGDQIELALEVTRGPVSHNGILGSIRPAMLSHRADTMLTATPPGNHLRPIREAMGLSVRELARRMNIDPSLVSRAERGQIPTWPKFRATAAAVLEIPEHVLFSEAP